MLNRLYNILYNKTYNISISKIGAKIIYIGFIFLYNIKKTGNRLKDQNFLTTKEAYKIVSRTHEKPNFEYSIKNLMIDKNLDLTFVVPVYNVKPYLVECLESIINQKTKYAFEVIIINDGSTDSPETILDRYKDRKDIKIVSQENKGLSHARNVGINLSRGNYIMFVDSDDIIDNKMVEVLLNEAYDNRKDIVACGYYNFNQKGEKKYFVNPPLELNEKNRKKILNYSGFACCKVFKRDLFNNVRFPLGYWFEDSVIKFILFRLTYNYSYIPKALYKRRENQLGITSISRTSVKAIDSYWILEDLIRISKENGIKEDALSYEILIHHLGSILYSRTINLDLETRKAIFLLSHNLLLDNKKYENFKLSYKNKEIRKSLLEKNFYQWEIASKYL